jgi:hypothetical protein
MTWMIDEHAGQILRGLANDQDIGRWKIWLRYGFIVLLAGIVVGGTFLKMRSPSAPIARATPSVAGEPETTMTFAPLLPADVPQGGWRNPEAEKMRRLLNGHPRAPKLVTAQHKRSSVATKARQDAMPHRPGI